MSSPILISSSSSALYVPVHRRNGSTDSSYSSTRSLSPLSSRGSPSPTPHIGVYTPTELLSLAHSPLVLVSGGDMDTRLRAVAPEVVQTRKQRKSLAWHARHPPAITTTNTHRGRSPPRRHVSESDDDRTSWRRA